MKNRIIVIVIIAILLFVGYVVSEHFNKEESNQEETINEVVEEVKEEPKEEIIEEKVSKTVKATEKNTKKSLKSPSKSTKKTTTKKKVVKSAPKVSYNKTELQKYAHDLVISYGWTEYDYECLVKLWNRESGWNPNAVNKKSGACGIPQSLPCKKMASEGSDYRTNGKTQIRWGLKYIKNRYCSPSNAWAHSQQKGWY